MKVNRVKESLRQGKFVVGSEISRIRSADVLRLYASAGLDFVFIDMEHTSFSLETVADMIESAHRHDIVPLVRIPQAEYSFVSRVLDAGASGIIVPRVNRADTVRDLVRWMRYPPLGERGFARTVGQTGGVPIDPASFIKSVHDNTMLIIQFERREAIDNLEEMISIEGVDVACLGYMDLTVDLGCPGELDNAAARACIEKMIDVSRSKGVAAGIISPDMGAIHDWIARGMRFVSYATETILLENAARDASRRIRMYAEGAQRDEAPDANGSPRSAWANRI